MARAKTVRTVESEMRYLGGKLGQNQPSISLAGPSQRALRKMLADPVIAERIRFLGEV